VKGSMDEIRRAEDRALEIAEQVAALMNEMLELAPTAVSVGPGRISGPGLEIRLGPGGFTVRT
jgi:hypothetical protein